MHWTPRKVDTEGELKELLEYMNKEPVKWKIVVVINICQTVLSALVVTYLIFITTL